MSDNIDKAAHDLMKFKPQKVTRVHGYEVFYHEERLYTVRDSITGITSLVYAREPREAAEKVIKMTVEPPMIAVERPKGKWIAVTRHEHYPSGRPYTDLFCPVCGRKDNNGDGKYCGYCGAEMEGDDER